MVQENHRRTFYCGWNLLPEPILFLIPIEYIQNETKNTGN